MSESSYFPPTTSPVPGGKGSRQPGWTDDVDSTVSDGSGPLEAAKVPFREGQRLGSHDEIDVETRVGGADFRIFSVEDEPVVTAPGRLVRELEVHHHPISREPVVGEIDGPPRMEHHSWVGVVGSQFEPLLAPFPQAEQNIVEISAHRCERISPPPAVGFRFLSHDSDRLELSQPGGQESAG